ncbi:MAG: carbohydrate ABC transporter permease [Inquilinaceae bacterium]
MTTSRAFMPLVFGLCLIWFLITLFPFYWTLITSFKPPNAVNGGPTYLPFIDFQPTVKAYLDAASGSRGDFVRPFVNSTLIGLSATFLSVLMGSMAAYALVRFPFRVRLLAGVAFAVIGIGLFLLGTQLGLSRAQAMGVSFVIALPTSVVLNGMKLPGPVLGNNDVVFWFVSQRMFPPIVTAFALYLLYSELGKEGLVMLDTYWGMTLCYTAFSLPIVIWLMRDFFQALPVEIEEAALVDDVPRLRIFFEIVLPMARPGLIATSMITLGFVWNEFLFALLLTTADRQTLPILLAGQNSYRGDEWWAISVAAMVSIGPMMIIAILLARLMRSGLTLGGIR